MAANSIENRRIPRSVLILAEIEGITGVNRKEQCKPNTEAWCDARYLITADVNVAVRGFAEGAVVKESESAVETLETILLKTAFRAYPSATCASFSSVLSCLVRIQGLRKMK